MKRTETTTRNYTNMSEYLRERAMIGDGMSSGNDNGECWTTFGKRVLYENDWGARDVYVFADADTAETYVYAMAGPLWDNGYIIREDITRNSGTACYTVEDPSGNAIAVASEWEQLAQPINEDMERSGYFPGTWLEEGTALSLDARGSAPILSELDIPDPVR